MGLPANIFGRYWRCDWQRAVQPMALYLTIALAGDDRGRGFDETWDLGALQLSTDWGTSTRVHPGSPGRERAAPVRAPMRLHSPYSKECHYRKVTKAVPNLSPKGGGEQ